LNSEHKFVKFSAVSTDIIISRQIATAVLSVIDKDILYEVRTVEYRKNLKEEYLRQSVMTATPIELTVMLFDGCIKDLRRAEVAMEEPRDLSLVNTYLVKAQKIITELMSALDLRYEVSEQLLPIYSYLLRTIRLMNIKKDLSEMENVLEILTAQRETWAQISRQSGGLDDGEGRQACV
jgi:flagellar protein FliS